MAGSSTVEPFFFDLGDPKAYVEAERLIATDPTREWVPARSDVALRCAHEGDALREDIGRQVGQRACQIEVEGGWWGAHAQRVEGPQP